MNSKLHCSTTTTGQKDSSPATQFPSPNTPTKHRRRHHRRSRAHCPKFPQRGQRDNPTDLCDIAANPRASGRESSGGLRGCFGDCPSAGPDSSGNRCDAPGVGRLAGSKRRSFYRLARAICSRDLASARSNLGVGEEEQAFDLRQNDLREVDCADSRVPH